MFQRRIAGIDVGIDGVVSSQARYSWPPEACVVEGIDTRSTFVVPENRTKPTALARLDALSVEASGDSRAARPGPPGSGRTARRAEAA